MRLRNRGLKASFWTDPELIEWPRDKRWFLASLHACAEDSCCLEDRMSGVKVAAWPAQEDADMTVDRFEQWLEELIAARKVVRYVGDDGKPYLYLPAMARHERPRTPPPPEYPLPPWVKYKLTKDELGRTRGSYEHSDWRPYVNGESAATPQHSDEPIPTSLSSVPVDQRALEVGILPLRNLLFEEYVTEPTYKNRQDLITLRARYADATPSDIDRLKYGIEVAKRNGKPNANYAIQVALSNSAQEVSAGVEGSTGDEDDIDFSDEL